MAGPAWTIFTEDSSDDADAAYLALIKKLALRLLPGVQTHKLDLRGARAESRAAMHGHRWRGDEVLRRALINELATRMKVGDVVVFHHDGDIPWQGAPGAPSHDRHFANLLRDLKRRLGTEEELPRLLRLVPHYSMESWLYLNRSAMERLVREGRLKGDVLTWLDEHADAAGGFDHVDTPKKRCPAKDQHNRVLAESSFPADFAATASPSWAETEARWAERSEILEALRETMT